MENKRGVMGLETAKDFILAILILAITAFAIVVVLTELSDTDMAKDATNGSILNETVTLTDSLTYTVLTADGGNMSCSPGIFLVQNASSVAADADATEFESGNYTTQYCRIRLISTATTNNTAFNVTYNWTAKEYNEAAFIGLNTTEGLSDFFENTSTWFALLAVVIIILIIAVVIIATTRFGGITEGVTRTTAGEEGLY